MANELTITASVSFSKGEVLQMGFSRANKQFNVTGTKYIHNLQSIGFAAAEALAIGEVATPGWCFFFNTDATNYVQILTAVAGTAFCKLKAKEFAMLRLPPGVTAPAAQADTAAVELQYMIVED